MTAEGHIIRQLCKGTTVCREGTACALCSQALRQGQESLKVGAQPQTASVCLSQLAAAARPDAHASLNFSIMGNRGTEGNRGDRGEQRGAGAELGFHLLREQ